MYQITLSVILTHDIIHAGIGFINEHYQSPIGRSYSHNSEESSSAGEHSSVEITVTMQHIPS